MYIGVCLLGMVEVRGTRGLGRGAQAGARAGAWVDARVMIW